MSRIARSQFIRCVSPRKRRERLLNYRKTPIALAAAALCGAISFAAEAAPTISWTTLGDNAVLRGSVSGTTCAVDTTGATRVTFWANNYQINNDYSAPPNCDCDAIKPSDSTYPL